MQISKGALPRSGGVSGATVGEACLLPAALGGNAQKIYQCGPQMQVRSINRRHVYTQPHRINVAPTRRTLSNYLHLLL